MSSSTAIPASSGVGIDRDDTNLARATMRRVSLRLLPFLFLIYIFNFLDRTNVAIAALQMNRDLGFSATAYGFGAGIFSLGYPPRGCAAVHGHHVQRGTVNRRITVCAPVLPWPRRATGSSPSPGTV